MKSVSCIVCGGIPTHYTENTGGKVCERCFLWWMYMTMGGIDVELNSKEV